MTVIRIAGLVDCRSHRHRRDEMLKEFGARRFATVFLPASRAKRGVFRLGLLPSLRYCLVFREQIASDLDFSPDKALMILLEIVGQISVIDRHSKRSLQPVRPQVSESVDSLRRAPFER